MNSTIKYSWCRPLSFIEVVYILQCCWYLINTSIISSSLVVTEHCFTSLSAQSWQYRDCSKPEVGTMLYFYWMTSMVLYSDSTIDSTAHSRPLNSMYMHNLNDKIWPGLDWNSVPLFRATPGSNEPSGSAVDWSPQIKWVVIPWQQSIADEWPYDTLSARGSHVCNYYLIWIVD